MEQNSPVEFVRVRDRIADLILTFCQNNWAFRADDLRTYISNMVGGAVAPGSPDRILRDLRQRGLIDYRVTNRRASSYEIISIANYG